MIKVLIVDDSALIREFMTSILNDDPYIEVVDAVPDPYKAVEILNSHKVDVISLDLEMPRMDGLTFLEKLMQQRPIPVVVCSSIAEQNSENAMKALQLGAVEVITKAKMGVKDFLFQEKERITSAIKAAAAVNLENLRKVTSEIKKSEQKGKKGSIDSKHLLSRTTDKVIAIGASTGGTVVLRYILSRLPINCYGIVVSQHMPEGFTAQFSNSLNMVSSLEVKESSDQDKISTGRAIIARGNHHLKIIRSGAFYQCLHSKEPQVNRHRPSVDVMFQSVAENVGKNALGILLTGMGKDGAEGLKMIKEAGGSTIAQNEQSCVVFGMPRAAIEIGGADLVLDIDQIIDQIIEFCKN
ncbi:MAG: chemotaxis response regulator protein-glutamate methylesterase [Spirochaetes bacterium]|nr:chemotaxis response regulator protein-glutamate methylesterase [Spirochaetota bacterium]